MPMIDAKVTAERLAQMRDNPPTTPTLYEDHDAAWQNAYAYAMGDARSALATLATERAHDEAVGRVPRLAADMGDLDQEVVDRRQESS